MQVCSIRLTAMESEPHAPRTDELHRLRVDYGIGALNESDVAADPIDQFARWFSDAQVAGIAEPNAMTLATADATGKPSARIVLLKDVDANGFTFFTNYGSRKGDELAANPRAALLFFWQPLERQVRIEGTVTKVSAEESRAYFAKRPRGARIGAWASRQSRSLESREALETAWKSFEAKFPDDVPLPEWWGGYRLRPEVVEFWQGRRSRLHDRLIYSREGGNWALQRIAP